MIRQGVDIVRTSKLRGICLRHEGFIGDVFTAGERAYCLSRRDPYAHFAGRFAAKEACLKALGRGLRTGADPILRDIEITLDASGRASAELGGRAAGASRRLGVSDIRVSIAHAGGYAISAVVLEVKNDSRGTSI